MEHDVDPSGYLSAEEVGRLLRASKWTVRRWIEAGKVPAVRIGRRWLIPREFVERVLTAGDQAMQEAEAHVQYKISRDPAPAYSFIKGVLVDLTELEGLIDSVTEVLRAGGLPTDAPESYREEMRKILTGIEPAPYDLWRRLAKGIAAIQRKD